MARTHRVLRSIKLISADQLDKMSEDGWELITIVQVGRDFYFYFRTTEE